MSVRTNWISGFGSFNGLSVWAETKAVLSLDAEQVLLAIDEVWNHHRLSSTGWVHLKELDFILEHFLINNFVVYFPLEQLTVSSRFDHTLVQALPSTVFFSMK